MDGPITMGDPTPLAAIKSLITRQVVRLVGFPKGLLRVTVHPLGGDRYRVNVHAGQDAASVRMVGSYFLTADGEGNILGSSPPVGRLF